MENTYQISDILSMENIYASIVNQDWHPQTKLVTSPDILILSLLYLGLILRNNLVTYNRQDENYFVVYSPQWPTLNMTKAGLLYHDINHLLKNKDAQIMVNESRSTIPQVNDKKKG